MLGYSWETNLSPKLDFLQRDFGLDDEALKARVLRLPSLLGYSVERRYRPRAARCRQAGLPVSRVLDSMAYSEARFSKMVDVERLTESMR